VESDRIEHAVVERHVLRIHHLNLGFVTGVASESPADREHPRADINADHLDVSWIFGDAQPGAEADVEHPTAHRLPHLPPPPAEHPLCESRLHRAVVELRIAVIDPLNFADATIRHDGVQLTGAKILQRLSASESASAPGCVRK